MQMFIVRAEEKGNALVVAPDQLLSTIRDHFVDAMEDGERVPVWLEVQDLTQEEIDNLGEFDGF